MTNGWLDGGWTSNPAFVQSLFKQWAIIPRFCRFYSLEEDGTFPRVIYKTWDIGRTVFQCPPCLWKTWDIGSTNFQCPPVFKKRGTLKISTPNVPRFLQKRGTLKNSTPNVPHFMKQSFTTIKVVNRHNQGIMKRSHGFPRGPWGMSSPRTSKLSSDWTFPRVLWRRRFRLYFPANSIKTL